VLCHNAWNAVTIPAASCLSVSLSVCVCVCVIVHVLSLPRVSFVAVTTASYRAYLLTTRAAVLCSFV